jgi:hypothetical protein
MFNLKKKEDKMSNKKMWLVIEKNVFGESQSFSVVKFADTVEGAMKFKVHLEALNDRKNQTYFLASDSDTIMNTVVSSHNKSVENGTYYDKHPEIDRPDF